MVVPDPVDIVYCEVCELPHRRKALECEQCQHSLGTAPDWDALRAEVLKLRGNVILGVLATLAMIVGTGWLLGGVGYIVAMGPMVWAVKSGMRWYFVAGRLRKRAGAAQRG
jgi:hypothetical protein